MGLTSATPPGMANSDFVTLVLQQIKIWSLTFWGGRGGEGGRVRENFIFIQSQKYESQPVTLS